MHVSDSMMQGAVCPVTALLSTAGLLVAGVAASKSLRNPSASLFGAVSAGLFAVQMLNVPLVAGVSGHVLGGVLASMLLGTPFGVLAMAVVVTLQALLFGDGGVMTLGANLLNMALLGAGVGGWLLNRCRASGIGGWSWLLTTGLVSMVSVLIAAVAVTVELAVSGTVSFTAVLPPMLGIHALTGFGEGLLTALVAWFWFGVPQQHESAGGLLDEQGNRVFVTLFVAVTCACCLSPFASALPDGLEWVLHYHAVLPPDASMMGAPAWSSAGSIPVPFPDYRVPTVGNALLTTGFAGLLGVLATFVAGCSAGRVLVYRSR